MRWLDGIIDTMDMNLFKLLEIIEDRGTWRAAVPRSSKGLDSESDTTITTKGLLGSKVIKMRTRDPVDYTDRH